MRVRRALVTSLGSASKLDIIARFDGGLASTGFNAGGTVRLFVEHVTSIDAHQENAAAARRGRVLLEGDPDNQQVLSAGVQGGTDPEAAAIISVTINPDMPVTSAFLYVNTVNAIPATATEEITSGLSGGTITWEYTIGAPNATRYFWVELVDASQNSSITPLGTYTTQDNTPPVLGALSLARGTPGTTSVVATFSATDNDEVETIYVLVWPDQSNVPSATEVKAVGQALAGTATSLTRTGLSHNTTYYGWILAKDRVGNETAVTSMGSVTTLADATPPSVDSATLEPGTDPESQVNIVLEVSDT